MNKYIVKHGRHEMDTHPASTRQSENLSNNHFMLSIYEANIFIMYSRNKDRSPQNHKNHPNSRVVKFEKICRVGLVL